MDTFPSARSRPALQALASAIDARSSSLRRDDCGDWRISGALGHIYADGDTGFVLYVGTEADHSRPMTARMWGSVRDKLMPSAALTQDGDAEGSFRLDRMPTPAEGATIRKALRIPKRIEHTPAYLEQLRIRLASIRNPQELALS